MTSCKCCGSTRKIQEEHIIAQSKQRTSKNPIPACAACNQSKGPKALMQWFRDTKRSDKNRWSRIKKHNKGKRSDIAKKVQKVRDE